MASIRSRRRADGTVSHQVIFRRNGRNSPQEFATFDDAHEAERLRKSIDALGVEEALALLDARETRAHVVTVGEWVNEHIDLLTSVTDGTRIRYRQIANQGLGKLAPLPLTALSERNIAAWIQSCQAEGLKAKTIANRHGLLAAAVARAHDRGLIAANPCKETHLPDGHDDGERVFLTHDEFAQLLGYIRPDAQDLVIALAGTGHRFGEETALQVRDWDSSNRRIRISRAWKYSGVSSKPTLGAPKTRRAKRTHSVALQVAEIYDRLCEGRGPMEFIFTNSKGDPWRASAFHSSIWQPAIACANGEDWEARRAQWEPRRAARIDGRRVPWRRPAAVPLGKRPSVHDLRHSAASWWLADGASIVAVSRRLGHESIKTTVDIYTHLMPQEEAVMDAAMTRALGPTSPLIEA